MVAGMRTKGVGSWRACRATDWAGIAGLRAPCRPLSISDHLISKREKEKDYEKENESEGTYRVRSYRA